VLYIFEFSPKVKQLLVKHLPFLSYLEKQRNVAKDQKLLLFPKLTDDIKW